MDLFSHFCNICYKTDDGNLSSICDKNKEHLKYTLITCIGHEDIINNNQIYLCQLCSEELKRFNEFKEMCFSNLIQLRQTYFKMKAKLEFEDEDTVTNILKEFLNAEILRNNSLRKIDNRDSISSELQKIVKDSEYSNKNYPTCNRQGINLHSERNGLEFDSNCSEISHINNNDCSDSLIGFTKDELHKNNEILDSNTENIKLEKVESETGRDFEFVVSGYDIPQIEFVKFEEKSNIKIEMENISENFNSKYIVNESDGKDKFLFDLPDINNSNGCGTSQIEFPTEELHTEIDMEGSNSKDLELKHFESESGEEFDFGVCNISKSDVNDTSRIEFMKDEIQKEQENCTARCIDNDKVKSGKSNGETVSTQQLSLHASEHCNGSCPTTTESVIRPHANSGAESCTRAVCHKTFADKSTLTKQELNHSDGRSYQCTVCDKVVTTASSLTKHERIHSGVRPYKCSVCNKAFADSSNLTKHERIHSGVRPYKCNVCNKAFAESGCLVKHQRIHSGSKPYSCTVCKKPFTLISNLYKHKRSAVH